jgi:hypothetical protein
MNYAHMDVNAYFFEDLAAEREHERYTRTRDALDTDDVLAEVESLMLTIARDEDHPLYALVAHCVRHGTTNETGQRPHMVATVGEAFLPLIERAIGRLVQERLLQDEGRDGELWGVGMAYMQEINRTCQACFEKTAQVEVFGLLNQSHGVYCRECGRKLRDKLTKEGL